MNRLSVLLRLVGCLALAWPLAATAQKAWFADGYHGGIYGHYPATFTQYMVDALKQNPDWKLNLEIEPETWDFARTNTPEAYEAFKSLVADQSPNGRIEFVNPGYGQSYLWNIAGESVIQQLGRGIRKIHEHFPNASFTTYCSEEPCFTTALPGILKSFGFKYAVLKNPNTCWGGYTRAFGGELVNWKGPDGTALPTVPRYAIEALKPGSTWETIAAANSRGYIRAAQQAGIAHPVGMCLQDAGWRFGPWLKRASDAYSPTEYVTWRHYFETVATQTPSQDWRVSPEDIQVSLVWGAQVLQRIAQQVRKAEDRLMMAEKLATLANVYGQVPWPVASFDEAWRTLMLAQHHDCWIVPYNGRPGNTWADKVQRWTEATREASEASIHQSTETLMPRPTPNDRYLVRVFNTVAAPRTNLVRVKVPDNWSGSSMSIRTGTGRHLASQVIEENGHRELLYAGPVPSCGYNSFWLERTPAPPVKGATAARTKDGLIRLETDLYKGVLDASKGGAFRSLIAKHLDNCELVDAPNARSFNEIRGYFPEQHRFCSTADSSAKIDILESGPVRICVRISGEIASNTVTQWITLVQGEPRMDFRVKIDWQGSPRIGADDAQFSGSSREKDRKAFYDDRFKLLALFPLNLSDQRVFKEAPFDVVESRLTNTFFDGWSEIKNNVILHWVDVFDAPKGVGVTLLSDHTTSYAHGADHPLGLTLQYSGPGLWGRDYSLRGPTEVNYALLPHAGTWQTAGLWTAANSWNEPFVVDLVKLDQMPMDWARSLLTVEGGGWEVPTMRGEGGKVLIRLFNATAESGARTVRYGGPVSKIELVQLNGKVINEIPSRKDPKGGTVFKLALPSMGIGTLKISPSGDGG
jgi:alpha-mannosidase